MEEPLDYSETPDKNPLEADRLRHRFEWLSSFTDDELRELSYCAAGMSLWPEEEYFNISKPELGVITVTEHIAVRDGECWVPRSAVSDRVWKKLTTSYDDRSI